MATNTNDDDEFLTFVAVIILGAVAGPSLLAHYVPAVADTLVGWHLLTRDAVLIPIAGTAGLDFARCAIAFGALLLAGVLLFLAARRTAAARAQKSGGSR